MSWSHSLSQGPKTTKRPPRLLRMYGRQPWHGAQQLSKEDWERSLTVALFICRKPSTRVESKEATGHRSQDFPLRCRQTFMSGGNMEMCLSLVARSQKHYICIHTDKRLDSYTPTLVLYTKHILLCSLADILSSWMLPYYSPKTLDRCQLYSAHRSPKPLQK